jgi:hypothetical protein
MSTTEMFFSSTGPLMTLAQLAKILDRSVEGLRISLRSETEFAQKINATRVRLGRRVYFSTAKIAPIIGID